MNETEGECDDAFVHSDLACLQREDESDICGYAASVWGRAIICSGTGRRVLISPPSLRHIYEARP